MAVFPLREHPGERKTVIQTETRNASLADLATLLQEQHVRKIDMVAPADKIRSENGVLVVTGTDPIITEDGVTDGDGRYLPTTVCDEGVAEKLGIPLAYVRKMRADRPDLYDANVNGWLHGRKPLVGYPSREESERLGIPSGQQFEKRPAIPGDERKFLLRGFRGDEGGLGIGRALLSDKYATMDNLDVLTAALDGVRAAGVEVEIAGCDLTDRRMYVRVVAPSVQALAPALLKNYRSPFTGNTGADNPTVFAGFEISNSEVGSGAFSIVPRLVIEVCKNGMKITKDALRQVHIGSRMDEGTIRWTTDTETKNLALVTAKTRDAVATFLDVDYMTRVIEDIEKLAGHELAHPVDTVSVIGKKLSFDQSVIDGVLGHFIRGGDTTAGGLMNAVTSWSQTIENADTASDLEAQALRVLELAVAL